MTALRSLAVLVAACAAALTGGCADQAAPPGTEAAGRHIPAPDSVRMGRATLTGGDPRGAIGFYEQALKARPDDYDANLGLADALARIGEVSAARKTYQRAAALNPGAIEPVLAQARLATRQRQLDEARRLFAQAATLAGADDPRALAGLGAVNDLDGRGEEARDCYRRALAIRPDDLATRNNLALSLALSGNPRQAIDLLLELAQNPSAPPQARHNLALAYGLLGNTEASENVLSADLDAGSVQNDLRYYAMLRQRLAEPPPPPPQPAAALGLQPLPFPTAGGEAAAK